MTPEAILTGIDKNLPGLNNFYMAGQWVEPGGGIAAALYSGRNLVKRLCGHDGKQFSTGLR
jgi:phytoene dehydrogenase-like protein